MRPKNKLIVIAILIAVVIYLYYIRSTNINPYISMLIVVFLLGLAISIALSLPK